MVRGYIKAGLIAAIGIASFSCAKQNINQVSNPTSSGIRLYGNDDGYLLYSFEPTADGGYMFGGATNASANNAGQGFIQKTDGSDNLLWSKEYGGPLQDLFTAVHTTSDGGFIAVGSTISYGLGATRKDYYSDCYMVKTDANGNQRWKMTFGDIYTDQFYDVAETPDHGFVAVGGTESATDESDLYIVKTDENGTMKWKKILFTQYFFNSLATAVTVNTNGNIAVAGYIVKSTFAIDQGTNYPAFMLFDSSGKALNSGSLHNPFPEYKNWGGLVPAYNNSFRSEKIISRPDGYIFAVNLNTPVNSLMLFKVNGSDTTTIWRHRYSGLGSASMNDAVNNSVGGLLISGVTIDPSGKNYFWMLNTDANGRKLWESHTPVPGFNAFAAGAFPVGSNYAIGVSLSATHKNLANNFGFLTTDQNGNIVEIKK